jgi:anaerobic ribonucleoside-triphosphate reductase activating protein
VGSPLSFSIHALLERSFANGPGCRAVIWLQGCSIRCDGCCNPDAQGADGGRVVPVIDLVAWVRSIDGIEGITVSGGEPLQQRSALGMFLREIRSTTGLSVAMFTGYDWAHVEHAPGFLGVAQLADVVIAGPFRRHQRLDRGLRGSANKTVHLLTDRYSPADLEAVPNVEVVIDENSAVLTGVNDASLA